MPIDLLPDIPKFPKGGNRKDKALNTAVDRDVAHALNQRGKIIDSLDDKSKIKYAPIESYRDIPFHGVREGKTEVPLPPVTISPTSSEDFDWKTKKLLREIEAQTRKQAGQKIGSIIADSEKVKIPQQQLRGINKHNPQPR